jgi:hypothetical protein
LRGEVVAPLIGERTSLAEADWVALKARFIPYQAWLARRPETPAAQLGIEPLRRLLASPAKTRIDALIACDKALEPAINAIARVEKLLRYQRDLLPLLNNMVSFRPF